MMSFNLNHMRADIVEEKLPSSRKVLFKALTDPFFILLSK